jgi:cell fate (sporulation/competence/biofilm development) regulator YlbF (YheA/YmcA/DUF963 family)
VETRQWKAMHTSPGRKKKKAALLEEARGIVKAASSGSRETYKRAPKLQERFRMKMTQGQVHITDAELRKLEALLQILIQDSELLAGLSVLEWQEIEGTYGTVRLLRATG